MKKYLCLKNKNSAGFSVVEFVVVISIFAIMSSVTIFNYGDYRQKVEELNVAQDIALAIRQAQIYGISASNKDVGQTFGDSSSEASFISGITDITDNSSVRGVSIEPDTNSIILFEDVNGNNIYNANTDVLIDRRSIITNRVHMKVCLDTTTPTDFTSCGTTESGNTPIDVTFQRPYPDSYVRYDGGIYTHVWLGFFGNITDAEPSSYIIIEPSGQISVIKN